jgi:hypothetical protein
VKPKHLASDFRPIWFLKVLPARENNGFIPVKENSTLNLDATMPAAHITSPDQIDWSH